MYQWTRENFTTEAITERTHFPTGILNKRVTEDLINQEAQWLHAISGSVQSGMCFLYIKFFHLWIIWFTWIESLTKRMMGLGLGLGHGFD